MTENLEYNDGLARAGGRQFEQAGDELTRLAISLEGELASDSPWSDDKIGSSFGSQFDPHRSTAISNVKNFAAKVDSYGPAIAKAADATTRTDGQR